MNSCDSLKLNDGLENIIKSNIEPSVSVGVNLQKDGILLAQDGEKLYIAEMRDRNEECLSLINKEPISKSDVTKVVFQKDIQGDDKSSGLINSCSDEISAIVPDSNDRLSSFKDSSLKKKDVKSSGSSKTLRTSRKRKRHDVERNSPMKKTLKSTHSSNVFKDDDHQRPSKEERKKLKEKASSQTAIQEQSSKQTHLHTNDLKLGRVKVSRQPKHCDAVTQTDPPSDFSCQTSFPDGPDGASLDKIRALCLENEDLQHELKVEKEYYEKNIAAARSVQLFHINKSSGWTAESQLNHNKSSQMDVNGKTPHSLLPPQPAARSSTIEFMRKKSN